jgi:PAS domain S-box-containing protein
MKKKILEKELKESLEKYRELFESISDAVAVFGFPDGNLIIYNKRFTGLLSYSEQELKGKRFSDFIYPEDLPAFRKRFEKRIAGETVEDIYEIRVFNKNGEVVFLEVGDRPYSQRSETVGIEVIMRDISERKNIEEQLIQSEKLRAIGQMASGVAYDFNNALAIILGNTESLARQVDMLNPEQIKRQLKVIEIAALDAAETVRRIQEFTRVRADKEYLKVNINEIVEEVKEMSKPRWKDQAQEQGINIEFETKLKQDLPSVLGSPSELRKVLTNIIFNSIDAMPKGGKIIIDLVFTDLGMPGMSGWEVAKSIKAKDSKVPVVLITGWGIQIDDEKMKESGADLILNKPFRRDQVLDLVAEAMDIKRKLSSS